MNYDIGGINAAVEKQTAHRSITKKLLIKIDGDSGACDIFNAVMQRKHFVRLRGNLRKFFGLMTVIIKHMIDNTSILCIPTNRDTSCERLTAPLKLHGLPLFPSLQFDRDT